MARNLMENGHPWGRLVQRFLARPSPKAYWLWMMRLSMYARYVSMMAFGKPALRAIGDMISLIILSKHLLRSVDPPANGQLFWRSLSTLRTSE